MLDWKPGDEVLCITDGGSPLNPTRAGTVYVIERVWIHPNSLNPVLDLVGVFNGASDWSVSDFWGHSATRFRKVERKTDKLSLTEWLSQPAGDTDRLDKTVKRPAKTRERA